MIRLDKYLAHAKVGSRKEVKKIIRNGWITINGELVKNDDYKVDENKDIVALNNEVINYQQFYYIMLNKPQGYLSSTTDGDYPSVLNLIYEPFAYDLYPVGRLDANTTGLMLLSNDGILTHNLLSPKKHVDKIYEVKAKLPITEAMINHLESEITFEGITYKPGKVKIIDEYNILLTISEGKFNQIKNMMKSAGNEVVSLNRIQMGNLKLDLSLEVGDYRPLSEDEIIKLKEN